jgi:hypothetical protein
MTDDKAPGFLALEVRDSSGRSWGVMPATPKNFSTGSTGFYTSGKVTNPDNPAARYQCGFALTLIGSKEK